MKYFFIPLFLGFSIAITTALAADNYTCQKNQSSKQCLICNCYHETRGEDFQGKVAVAKTVLSRVGQPGFKKTVCEVVYQNSQFSWTFDKISNNMSLKNSIDTDSYNECKEAVKVAEREGGNGLLYFYNPSTARPLWAKKMKDCGKAGEHKFMVQANRVCPKYLGVNKSSKPNEKSSKSSGGKSI